MAKGKKIKLQKRSTPLTRTREGLSLPEGAGNSGYIGFQNAQDLKEKYFVRTGRLGRMPFALRMFVLFVAQFMFTFILYNRIVEGIILGQLWICALFGILLILFTDNSYKFPFFYCQRYIFNSVNKVSVFIFVRMT